MSEDLVASLPYGLVGLALGGLHFFGLRLNARLYLRAGAFWQALLWQIGRIAVAVVAFALVARAGAAPLLAAFAGFLLCRLAVHFAVPAEGPGDREA